MEEVEAENLSLRAKDMEKQLDNKAISDDVAANNKAIEEIDNKIKTKLKLEMQLKRVQTVSLGDHNGSR